MFGISVLQLVCILVVFVCHCSKICYRNVSMPRCFCFLCDVRQFQACEASQIETAHNNGLDSRRTHLDA